MLHWIAVRRRATSLAALAGGSLLSYPSVRAADPPPALPAAKAPTDQPSYPPVAPPGSLPRPAYAQAESLPIDLPTVLRLVNENSPTIGFAQARVRAAQARLDRAEVAWVPDLVVGLNYNRFDGQTQNQRGEVFGVSRANLFAGGGPSVRLDVGGAYFGRLIVRRLTAAERQAAVQTAIDAQLEAVLAYLDLLQVYGQLAVNADTLEKAEAMLRFARNAQAAGSNKTVADVNRAQTEVYVRQQERTDLLGRAGAASARLARVLLLQPTTDLRPTDADVVPVVLIDAACTLDDLVAIALRTRPDLAASRELVAAAQQGVRQARTGPLLPRVVVEQQTGGFGGGRNDFLGDFSARSQLAAGVFWELNNFGLGDAARTRERRAELEQTQFRLTAAQARVGAEVSEAARVAGAKYDQLEDARKAVAEASETYRKLRDSSFNMVGPRAQYDALEPLTAIQQLNQTRLQYLSAVADFNRAQFRLFAALGYPVDQSQPRTPPPARAVPSAPAASQQRE
jgi:outer membrane protein TolC